MSKEEIAAFRLGLEESGSEVGMTYDGDAESPRSQAYDTGRTVGEMVPQWRSLITTLVLGKEE